MGRPAYQTTTKKEEDGRYTIQVAAYPIGGDPKTQGRAVFTLSGVVSRSKGLVVARKWIDNDIKFHESHGKDWVDVIQSDEYKALITQQSGPEPEDITPTPYGVVRGPKSAVEYIGELVRGDTTPAPKPFEVSDDAVEAACSRFVSESDQIWTTEVWPEHPEDDGKRGDAYVRILSEDDQHQIREAMRFALKDALATMGLGND